MSEEHSLHLMHPPQGKSGLGHTHTFQIVSAQGLIMRICPGCGKTWILDRPTAPTLSEWIEIQESKPVS